MAQFDDFLLGYPPERYDYTDDDLECPQCGEPLELIDGGMFECPVCAFQDNDPASEEEEDKHD